MPVLPGRCPIDPETGIPTCPPPTEIDIIKVKKVFEECMHTQVEEIPIPYDNPIDPDTKEATEVLCGKVKITSSNCEIIPGTNQVKVTFTVKVCSKVPKDSGGYDKRCNTLQIIKRFRMTRAGEEGLNPQCHIFAECLQCFISKRVEEEGANENAVLEVICCVGILILLKLDAEVQLMIPTYGYPPKPPECTETEGSCPDGFEPDWPPYPDQTELFPKRGCTGCNDK